MLIEKRKKNVLNFKNFNFVLHHSSILKDILQGKNRQEILTNARRLKELQTERLGLQECQKFISYLKNTSPYHVNQNYKPKLNRLCYIEDWENNEIRETISELQGNPEIIRRKEWEWALGIESMRRLGKLNNTSKALGVASAHEPILFYLANKLNHVYATDLYDPKYTYTQLTFLKTQRNMHLFHIKKMH
jgi:hypothetical protein